MITKTASVMLKTSASVVLAGGMLLLGLPSTSPSSPSGRGMAQAARVATDASPDFYHRWNSVPGDVASADDASPDFYHRWNSVPGDLASADDASPDFYHRWNSVPGDLASADDASPDFYHRWNSVPGDVG